MFVSYALWVVFVCPLLDTTLPGGLETSVEERIFNIDQLEDGLNFECLLLLFCVCQPAYCA